jgi:hypothetical protein
MRHQQGSYEQKLSTGAHASDARGCDYGINSRIAYILPSDSLHTHSRLVIYNVNSDTYQWIQEHPVGFAENPRWSAGGDRVLFNSVNMGACFIELINEQIKQLLPWEKTGNPCWLHSTSVLFPKNGNLYKIDTDGQNRVSVHSGDFYTSSMDYLSKDKKLAFSLTGIWVMDLSDVIED